MLLHSIIEIIRLKYKKRLPEEFLQELQSHAHFTGLKKGEIRLMNVLKPSL